MSARIASLAAVLAAAGAIAVSAQQQPADPGRTPGVQQGQDPNRAAFLAASCKNPPAPAPARGGGPGRAAGPGPAAPPAPQATPTARSASRTACSSRRTTRARSSKSA
jgi:hypothetical protein